MTPTTSRSTSLAPRRMMSRWPSVIGVERTRIDADTLAHRPLRPPMVPPGVTGRAPGRSGQRRAAGPLPAPKCPCRCCDRLLDQHRGLFARARSAPINDRNVSLPAASASLRSALPTVILIAFLVEQVVGNLESRGRCRGHNRAAPCALPAEPGPGSRPASTAAAISAPVFSACSRVTVGRSKVVRSASRSIAWPPAIPAGPAARARSSHQFGAHERVGMGGNVGQHLERQRVQRIACKNRGRLVERLVHRWLAAAQIVVIHRRQVVVDRANRRASASSAVAARPEQSRRDRRTGRRWR